MQKMVMAAPAMIDDLFDAQRANTTLMVTTHSGGKNALAALGYSGTMTESDTSSVLTLSVNMIVITPMDEGICIRRGEYGYLTCAELLSALSENFADMTAQESQDVVLLLMGGTDETDLATALAIFNAAWPIIELERVQRRMGNLATLERDKLLITEAFAFPYWRDGAPVRHDVGLRTAQSLESSKAIDEGMDELSVSLEARLSDFATRHSDKVSENGQKIEALQAALTGEHDGFFVHATQGTPTALWNELADMPAPLAESYKCVVGVCWYGEADNMTYIKQLLGVA